MKKRLRSLAVVAALFLLLFQHSVAAISEVSVSNELQAGYLVAKNAERGVINTVVQSSKKLNINQVYMAAECVSPLYFTILYYPDYSTLLDITLDVSSANKQELAKKEAKKVIAKIIKPGMTTLERAKAISDYIADVCVYDEKSANNVDTAPDETFTAYGALVKHLAVCAGYSRAFLLLCDEANVPSIFVPAPDMNHAFNAVSLYGDIQYVDVTYNDAYPVNSKYRSSYFMLTSTELKKDHVWDENMTKTIMNYKYTPAYYKALKLYDLGLMKGTGSGFELDKKLTRAEAAVMLVRLLGAEQQALSKNYDHPFQDVPSWADHYIGYLYQKNLTKGISKTIYGSNQSTTLNDYLTFSLRALGYIDGKDFEWSQAETFATQNKMIDANLLSSVEKRQIDRGSAAQISFSTLLDHIKGNTQTRLCDQLLKQGMITEHAAKAVGIQ
ncbi:MAG: S-layer homology domain-containing protein [Clostridiales bacterium]|nr:S-layer homology domain-containing protein [Clostridiales bacterium]